MPDVPPPLDLSGLTGDQLVALARAVAAEIRLRDPAVQAAAQAAVIDEAEKARIAQQAAEREAAAQRARERERIAAEAAARVRAEHAARTAAEKRERSAWLAAAQAAEAAAKASASATEAIRRDERRKAFLARAAALVDLPPHRLTIVIYSDHGQKVVHLNEGQDRYSREHKCSLRGQSIETRRRLIGRKPELAQLCAEMAAIYTDAAIVGADHFAPETQETARAQ